MLKEMSIYVSHVGLNKINLGGRDVLEYSSLPKSQIIGRDVFAGKKKKKIKILIIQFDE